MSHSLRVRDHRWEQIEAIAFRLSQDKGKIVKPSDVADALLFKNMHSLTNDDVELAKGTQRMDHWEAMCVWVSENKPATVKGAAALKKWLLKMDKTKNEADSIISLCVEKKIINKGS